MGNKEGVLRGRGRKRDLSFRRVRMRVPFSRERGREYCAFQKLRRPKRNRDAERCFAFRLNETSLRVECETERNRRGIRPSARESPFVSQK